VPNLKHSPNVLVLKQGLISFLLSNAEIAQQQLVSDKDAFDCLFVIDFWIVTKFGEFRNSLLVWKMRQEFLTESSVFNADSGILGWEVVEKAWNLFWCSIFSPKKSKGRGLWGLSLLESQTRFSEMLVLLKLLRRKKQFQTVFPLFWCPFTTTQVSYLVSLSFFKGKMGLGTLLLSL